MAKFKIPQRKLTSEDLDLIRVSVLKSIEGKLTNPEFMESLLNISNDYNNDTGNVDVYTPDTIGDVSIQNVNSKTRHLLLMYNKVSEYLASLFIYEGAEFDYDKLEHTLIINGSAVIYKYGGEWLIGTGEEIKNDKNEITGITINSTGEPTDGITITDDTHYIKLKNNYQGIGDIWLVWDIINRLADEYNEWTINSLLTRERLAVAGVGKQGGKLVDNLIKALHSGTPVLNFDGLDKIEKILQGAITKDGIIKFENRIENIIKSYNFGEALLSRNIYLLYNDSKDKKERTNVSEVNMENVFVKTLLQKRLEYRKRVNKLFPNIKVSIMEEVLGKDLLDASMEAQEKGKE